VEPEEEEEPGQARCSESLINSSCGDQVNSVREKRWVSQFLTVRRKDPFAV
jgi:hypothetical protein